MLALYAAVQTNAWMQSTIFHARDLPVTETFDYHGATLALVFALALSAMFNMPRSWPITLSMPLALVPLLCFWVAHVRYLHWVEFDYSYNMKVAVTIGISASLLWLLWVIRNRRTCRSFGWKMLVASWGPYLALPLELRDFPPVFGLLDAHATWHLVTIPMSFSFYGFLRGWAWHLESAKVHEE